MNEWETSLLQYLAGMTGLSFRLAGPLSSLHLIREKISARGARPFDKDDVMAELARVSHILVEFHLEMRRIEELLKSGPLK